ncbi:MAG: L,D-transpeptidase family protein [Phycisphaerales bacterium]|nr:L,D-transpeptidase family protein [Phycisphaerales bacterium]
MTLPSQSPRVAAAGRAIVRTHHRRGLRVPRVAIAGLIVVVGVSAAFLLTRGKDGKRPDRQTDRDTAADPAMEAPFVNNSGKPAAKAASGTGTGSLTDRRTTPPPSSQPADPAPFTISQAGGNQAQRPAGGATETPHLQLPKEPAAGSLEESLNRSVEPAAPPPTPSELSRTLSAADQRLSANDPVAARSLLTRAMSNPGLSESDRSQLRARITDLNQELLFSSKVVKGDPMTEIHVIASGERLSTLPDKLGLAVDWRLLQRINGLSDPNKIQLGQKIKIVRGPFHAVVHKGDFRLDLFAGPPEEESGWTYIRSFRVGLGEPKDSPTPTGSFVVKRNSKLVNPHWVNPKTGEKFDKDDPKNPIGERWIGLEGIGDDSVKTGYGIHGTIDPASVGGQKSMGCVRMLDDDVELVYGLLVEGISRVKIVD